MSRLRESLFYASLATLGLIVILALSAAADTEPNDDLSHAEAISEGTHSGTLDIIGDSNDFYSFPAPAGCLIHVDLKVTTAEDISLTVVTDMNSALTVSAKGGENATLDYISKDSVAAATWYIQVRHLDVVDGAYEFTFSVAVQDDAGAGRDAGETTDRALDLTYGTAVTGQAGHTDTADNYRFKMGFGQVATVDFASHAVENMTLRVLDSSHKTWWSMESRGGGTATHDFTTSSSTSSSWFFIRVETQYANRGTYELNVSERMQKDAGVNGDAGDDKGGAYDISPGEHDGEMADLDEYDWYRFEANGGDVISVSFSSTATAFEQRLEVYDSMDYRRSPTLKSMNGQVVNGSVYTAYSGGGTVSWYIKVEGVRNPGHYAFNLTVTPQDDGGSGTDAGDTLYSAAELTVNETVEGTLGGLDHKDTFKFQAGQGDVVNVTVTHIRRGGSLYALVKDDTDTGHTSGSIDDFGTVHLHLVTSAEDIVRWWYVLVQGQTEVSDYELTVNVTRQNDAGMGGDGPAARESAWALSVPASFHGQLGDLDAKDTYVFDFEGGDIINVSITGKTEHTVEVHMYIGETEVMGPHDSGIGSSDNATASDEVITAFEDTGSVAHLEVLHKIFHPAGMLTSYTVTVTITPQDDLGTGQDAPGAHSDTSYEDAIPLGTGSTTGTIGERDWMDFFYVTVSPRVPVEVHLTGPEGAMVELWLSYSYSEYVGEKINSEGETVSKTYIAPSTVEPDTVWYIIVNHGWGAIRSYELDVTVGPPVEDTSPPVVNSLHLMANLLNAPAEAEASIDDDLGVTEARLHYRVVGDETYDNVTMVREYDTIWRSTVPAAAITGRGVEYYVWVTDGTNEVTHPAGGDTSPERWPEVQMRPAIEHTAPGTFTEGKDVELMAVVTSNMGDPTVKLYYRMEGETTYNVLLMERDGGEYVVSVPKDHVSNGTMEYYIVAVNGAGYEEYHGSEAEPNTLVIEERKDDGSPGMGAVAALAAIAAVSIAVASRRRR